MDYWAKRTGKAQEKLTTKNITETEAQIKKYYQRSMKRTLDDFEKTYNKVLVSIGEGREPTPADLYKLDTYWKMQGQLRHELEALGDKQVKYLSKKFESQFHEIYNSIALKGDAAFGTIDEELAKQLINQIWCADGQSWSSRVWTNTSKLQQELNDGLVECLITGKKSGDLKKLLMERFEVSYNRADTLVRTEMAHIQTQAAQQRYKDYGISEVEILVDRDERTCDVCAELEGKRYPIKGRMPVPAHPRCRCCIVPVVE